MQNDDNSQQNPPQDQSGQSPKSSVFTSAIEQHADTDINPETQQMLNKPLAGNMDPADQEFLKDVVNKVDSGEIDLYRAQSLLNTDIYESLTPKQEVKVDMTLQNLLFSLRQIKSWHDGGESENVQMANMITDARVKKENLEKEVGDVLKI